MALVRGAPLPGGMVLFRQTNEMYYLTGVEVPHAYLLIDGDTGASTLYLPHLDAGHARSAGDYLNADDAELGETPDAASSGSNRSSSSPATSPATRCGRPRRAC